MGVKASSKSLPDRKTYPQIGRPPKRTENGWKGLVFKAARLLTEKHVPQTLGDFARDLPIYPAHVAISRLHVFTCSTKLSLHMLSKYIHMCGYLMKKSQVSQGSQNQDGKPDGLHFMQCKVEDRNLLGGQG